VKRGHEFIFWYVIIAMFAVLMLESYFVENGYIQAIPYSEFEQILNEGKIDKLVIGRTRITGAYKDPAAGTPKNFTTLRVEPELTQSLNATLAAKNIKYSGEPEPGMIQTLFSWVLPVLGFVFIWMFLARRTMGGQSGLMAIGKSKAKIYVERHQGDVRRRRRH